MAPENNHGHDTEVISLRNVRPAVSSRRRLQNREAQRRYREKTGRRNPVVQRPRTEAERDITPNIRSERGSKVLAKTRTGDQRTYPQERIQVPSAASTPTSTPDQQVSPPYRLGNGVGHSDPHSTHDADTEGSETREPTEPVLHLAVRTGKTAIVGMLISYDAAKWSDRDRNGATALHIATELGDERMVACLLQFGADTTVRDDRGQDVLYTAVSAGHTSIVKLILDRRRAGYDAPFVYEPD
ncbi:ankyrin [Pseudovirgaria hyperparasitica]|uniref:Ankyrin n=1 Tax=Pseudovirgaria hyperparasitica TaxID=470096 RepID=A0A6A6VV05_9PEZI|nr:ankyrin [Pseudovirgaria hyperparasitica]KAF2754518.1 ankyrin [Pseudovirgaria hyperparasitica]